jgi:HEAT repeat protein
MLEPNARRAMSERIVRYGVDDLGPVKELINREPTFLAQEAIFILGRIATPEAQTAIRDARVHPKLHVRLALVESLRNVPAELALGIALDLLAKEEDPKVLAATARSLQRYKTKETSDALDAAANRLPDRPLPYDTKLAILFSFASLNPGKALPLLARYVRRGEGLLVRRDAEELAAAAVRALGSIRGQRNSEIVEKATQSRSKLVREAAREVLGPGEPS